MVCEMKKYLVYGELADGNVYQFNTFAGSKQEAEANILRTFSNLHLVKVQGFDYNIQFI